MKGSSPIFKTSAITSNSWITPRTVKAHDKRNAVLLWKSWKTRLYLLKMQFQFQSVGQSTESFNLSIPLLWCLYNICLLFRLNTQALLLNLNPITNQSWTCSTLAITYCFWWSYSTSFSLLLFHTVLFFIQCFSGSILCHLIIILIRI